MPQKLHKDDNVRIEKKVKESNAKKIYQLISADSSDVIRMQWQ